MKIFFIGAGNAAKIIVKEMGENIDVAYVFDKDMNNASEMERHFKDVKAVESRSFKNLEVDYVIECASVEAVKEFGFEVLQANKDFIILSTGSFADDRFREDFLGELSRSKSRVYIPSGAVGGVDIINSIGDKLETIALTTRKPPKSLGIDDKEKETIVFKGSAKEAIKRYPKNINVAVTLSLAARSFDKVSVKIIADPGVERNIHEVEIHSKVGRYRIILENYPSPNPRTSYLAPLSIVGLLKKMNDKMRIGV